MAERWAKTYVLMLVPPLFLCIPGLFHPSYGIPNRCIFHMGRHMVHQNMEALGGIQSSSKNGALFCNSLALGDTLVSILNNLQSSIFADVCLFFGTRSRHSRTSHSTCTHCILPLKSASCKWRFQIGQNLTSRNITILH